MSKKQPTPEEPLRPVSAGPDAPEPEDGWDVAGADFGPPPPEDLFSATAAAVLAYRLDTGYPLAPLARVELGGGSVRYPHQEFFPDQTRLALAATFLAAAFTVFAGCHREPRHTYHEERSVAQEALQRLHVECSSDRDCGLSQVCIRWADEASRERKTCEVTCEPSEHEPDSQCPYPLICVTVTDGPGNTCQKRVGPP